VNSREARPVIIAALKAEGEPVDAVRVYVTQALARFDGGYGHWTSPPHGPEAPTSNNWGAVQHPDLPKFRIYHGITNPSRDAPEVKELRRRIPPPSPRPTEWFYGLDFYPPSRGGQGWFWGPYRVYPTPVDGARHVVRLLRRMGVYAVAETERNWMAVARQLHDEGYFTGWGDDEASIEVYARNLEDGGKTFEKTFGETSPIGWDHAPVQSAVPSQMIGQQSDGAAWLLLLVAGSVAVYWWYS